MKRFIPLIAVAVLAITGCGKSTHVTTVSSGQATAVATQAQTEAQQVVNQCMKNANFVTKSGRKAFLHCVAPAGHSKALEACVVQVAEHSFSITGVNEPKAVAGLAKCVESNR
jgi:hypothetical protein